MMFADPMDAPGRRTMISDSPAHDAAAPGKETLVDVSYGASSDAPSAPAWWSDASHFDPMAVLARAYRAVSPPSTTSSAPVTNFDSSLAR